MDAAGSLGWSRSGTASVDAPSRSRQAYFTVVDEAPPDPPTPGFAELAEQWLDECVPGLTLHSVAWTLGMVTILVLLMVAVPLVKQQAAENTVRWRKELPDDVDRVSPVWSPTMPTLQFGPLPDAMPRERRSRIRKSVPELNLTWATGNPYGESLPTYDASVAAAQCRLTHVFMPRKELLHLEAPFQNWNWRQAPPSCALVGNSMTLLWARYGQAIDSHQVVMRLNHAPVGVRFSEQGARARCVRVLHQVGCKVTHRWLNTPWAERYERNNLNCTFNRSQRCRRGGYSGGGMLVDSRAIVARCTKLANSPSALEKGVLCPTPSLQQNATVLWKRMRRGLNCTGRFPITPDQGDQLHTNGPSTGYYAMFALLHLCRHVTLYGFGIGDVGDAQAWAEDRWRTWRNSTTRGPKESFDYHANELKHGYKYFVTGKQRVSNFKHAEGTDAVERHLFSALESTGRVTLCDFEGPNMTEYDSGCGMQPGVDAHYGHTDACANDHRKKWVDVYDKVRARHAEGCRVLERSIIAGDLGNNLILRNFPGVGGDEMQEESIPRWLLPPLMRPLKPFGDKPDFLIVKGWPKSTRKHPQSPPPGPVRYGPHGRAVKLILGEYWYTDVNLSTTLYEQRHHQLQQRYNPLIEALKDYGWSVSEVLATIVIAGAEKSIERSAGHTTGEKGALEKLMRARNRPGLELLGIPRRPEQDRIQAELEESAVKHSRKVGAANARVVEASRG